VDIVLAQWGYFLSTNDTQWLNSTGWPMIKNAAEFFSQYAVMNSSTGNEYYTFNLTDPDEYANHVNNGAYTNAGIAKVMEWATNASQIVGETPDPKWLDIATKIHIPTNESLDLTLEYDGMNSTAAIKQADVVLMTYPLDYRQPLEKATRDLQYYANRQSRDGPAMTYAIFAIDTAQLDTQGCSSYTYMLYSSQPYLRRPFYQFSEQMLDDANLNGGTNPAFPFLTGHGGFLQVFTHGLTGYRPRLEGLYLDPSLPPQLQEGVAIKGLKFQGGVFDVNITLTNTTITRKPDWTFTIQDGITMPEDSKPINVIIGARNAQAGNYSLNVNETLSIPTYRTDLNGTLFPGNIAQCKPVMSEDAWMPGSFPVSLNDGDNTTQWQPLASGKAYATIDLGDVQNFSQAYFLWGPVTPKKMSLGIITNDTSSFSNLTSGPDGIQWLFSDKPVIISQPWDNSTDLVFPIRNDTTVALNDTFSSRFVQIAIEGSYDSNTTGATVAEISLS
jgi:hypothetical protein